MGPVTLQIYEKEMELRQRGGENSSLQWKVAAGAEEEELALCAQDI